MSRNWSGFAGAFFLAGLLVHAAFGAAAESPTRPSKENEQSISLHDFARELGLTPSWVEPGKKLQLKSKWSELNFTADTREMELSGVRVFMGNSARKTAKTLDISPIDRARLLLPIMAPQLLDARGPIRVVALDPGHGGRDNGTRNQSLNLREKELTLDVAMRLKALLEQRGFKVVLTRTDDTYIDLEERPKLAAAAGADVFISIHFNAVGRAAVSGLETYALTPQHQYSTGSGEPQPEDATAFPGNKFDGWNAYLGYTMQRHLLGELGLVDRGVKKARFVMLMGLECPGVLVEGGFLSNPEEGKLIATSEYRQRFAEAIAGGVEVYNGTLKRLEANRASAQD